MCKKCIEQIQEHTGNIKWMDIQKKLIHIGSTVIQGDKLGNCICGHEIRTEHEIEHTPSGYVFKVGSSCIKQMIKDKENQIRKKCLYQWCGICKKDVARDRYNKHCEGIRHIELEKKQKKLEEKKRNEKRCDVCLCKMLRGDWRTTCKSCYTITKYGKKACKKCGVSRIKDMKYSICYKCHIGK